MSVDRRSPAPPERLGPHAQTGPPSQHRAAASGFDKLARAYRWMEYLSFGPLLRWTRTAWLDALLQARTALVLGDGDGRFTVALLQQNRGVRVIAVDASPAMLAATEAKAAAADAEGRLHTVCADARGFTPERPLDLICTHFFLDCLNAEDARTLVARYAASLRPGGLWVVSEFAIPAGVLRLPATVLVRGLYAAFRLLTGLRVKALPDYAAALRATGLERVGLKTYLGGMLRAELWMRSADCAPGAPTASMHV